MQEIIIIGAGSWGTALAQLICANQNLKQRVVLCSNSREEVESLKKEQENKVSFPGFKLNPKLEFQHIDDLKLKNCELLVLSVPSRAMRAVAQSLKIPKETILLNTAKGIEAGSLKRMSEVLVEEQGFSERVASLSGPSFAFEVLRGLPTAVTIASHGLETLDYCVSVFHQSNFRIYTSDDLIGVELGGVVKNVIALAAGMLDGANMGNNARAGMITRGMMEMQELCVALGAKKETIYGLSGLGDLLLTATGDLSRNRTLGLRFGQGEKLDHILSDLGQVAEAATSTGYIVELAKRHNLVLPIIFEVDKVLKGERTVQESIKSLLARKPSKEFE